MKLPSVTALATLATLLAGCELPGVTIPLPRHCERVAGQELPGLVGLPHGAYDTTYTLPLGEALQTETGAVELSAWLSFLQASAVEGNLDFVESLTVSAASPGVEGAWTELANFLPSSPGEVGSIAILATTGADLLSLVPADGNLPVRLQFVGTPPESPTQITLTACVSGEAHYQL